MSEPTPTNEQEILNFSYSTFHWDTLGPNIPYTAIEDCRVVDFASIRIQDSDSGASTTLPFQSPHIIHGIRLQSEPSPEPGETKSIIRCEFYSQLVNARPDGFKTISPDGPHVRIIFADAAALPTAFSIFGMSIAERLRKRSLPFRRISPLLENPILGFVTANSLLELTGLAEIEATANLVAKDAEPKFIKKLIGHLTNEIVSLRSAIQPRRIEDFKTTGDPPVNPWNETLSSRLLKLGAIQSASAIESSKNKTTPQRFWTLWIPKEDDIAAPAITLIAHAIWNFRIVPEIEREKKNRPALVVPVMMNVVEFHSRGRVFDKDNGQLSFDGREVAKIMDTAIATIDMKVLQRGLGLLGSKLSHDVLRYEVFESHRRAQEGIRYANILEVEGGWTAFAELLGYDAGKYAADIKTIIYAQAHFRFTFPDGSCGNMLSYTEKKATGRKEKATVCLTIGSPLLPGFIHDLAQKIGTRSLPARQALRLVPMPRYLPPFHGRPNEHGNQASFAMTLMTEFRERATELAEYGFVHLTHDDLTIMADKVSLPRSTMLPMLKHWTKDVGSVPAFIKVIESDRYTLADAHEMERNFIIDAGKRELRNKIRGAASAKKKALGRSTQETPTNGVGVTSKSPQ